MIAYKQRDFGILYIDETSTHLWDNRGKVWQYPQDKLRIARNPDRGHGITVFGCLFSTDSRVRFTFGKSTNKLEFLDFLKNKVHPFVNYPRSTVLILDNHAAHHSHLVRNWIASKGYRVHFLPPYSSELNPIETVWSMMKREWGQHLIKIDF